MLFPEPLQGMRPRNEAERQLEAHFEDQKRRLAKALRGEPGWDSGNSDEDDNMRKVTTQSQDIPIQSLSTSAQVTPPSSHSNTASSTHSFKYSLPDTLLQTDVCGIVVLFRFPLLFIFDPFSPVEHDLMIVWMNLESPESIQHSSSLTRSLPSPLSIPPSPHPLLQSGTPQPHPPILPKQSISLPSLHPSTVSSTPGSQPQPGPLSTLHNHPSITSFPFPFPAHSASLISPSSSDAQTRSSALTPRERTKWMHYTAGVSTATISPLSIIITFSQI